MTEGIWIALIGVVAAGLGSFVGMLFGRRKLEADAAQIVSNTAVSLIKPLQERLETVEDELETEKEVNRIYRRALDEWREGFEILDCQMRENNLTPNWSPPPIPDVPTRPRKDRKP